MKKLLLLITVFVIIISCSSDDNETSLNINLLYGTWNRDSEYLCPNQNNITFNEDDTYVKISSGNSCDNNENDTYQYTGTYELSSNNIRFNQLTQTVIEGGSGTSISDFETIELISQKIIILTETQLVIERVTRNEISNETITNNRAYIR